MRRDVSFTIGLLQPKCQQTTEPLSKKKNKNKKNQSHYATINSLASFSPNLLFPCPLSNRPGLRIVTHLNFNPLIASSSWKEGI